ncbi:MAG TPA: ActS/PrrB/RegB family redox-sensitive histidine kinase, partial [Afifellaceae bacterium]|nr:ActS/PrrB/RegB family redox-sensitive histidine kinase [Afifellaceae bacterium]
NIYLDLRFPPPIRLDSIWTTAILAYDVLQLAGLLYLTGGLENPFAILLLGPVVVSATTQQPDKTFLLGALVLLSATALIFVHEPLPWYPDQVLEVPLLFVAGFWVALLSSLCFIAFFAFRVSEEARQLAGALAATELVLQREKHLSALDGLAAAAAHELGTPLGTIALVAKELESELAADDPQAEDIRLLRSQTERCREILSKLTSLSSMPEGHMGRMPISHILEDVAAPHRDFGIAISLSMEGSGPEPVTERNPGLLYGLGNILENAVDFATANVELEARWDANGVTVVINDDGPGFSPDIVGRLGEPYVTTRRLDSRASEPENGGLGLGVFIAKTLLGRSGASVTLANRKVPETGASVRVYWPRAAFDTAVHAVDLKIAAE